MTEVNHRMFLEHFLPVDSVLRAYLLAATGDMHAADDLLQEVSSVLWEKFEKYDESRPFEGWAIGIARMEVLKWRQRLARSREVLSPEAVDGLADMAVDLVGEIDDRAIHLRRCVAGLKERTLNLLNLRYWKALPIQQISDNLGKSVAAIEMALVRIRRQLRECVERRLKSAERSMP